MIDWTQIPQFAGDLEQLEKDAGTLAASATRIREHGADVHTRFQGLKACYEAPEAEQLFAATAPVKSGADTFGDDLHTVSSALSDYATEVRPLAARLKTLRARAHAFTLEVADDDDWTDDHDEVERHKTLMHDVNTCVQAFYTAEITAANKIQALFCGMPFTLGDGRGKGAYVYGVTADVLDRVEKTPWGTDVEQSHPWYDVGHQLKSFVWDGFVVDGVWGTLKGLGTLAAVGTEEGRRAWKGLAHLAAFAAPGGILTVALAAHYGPKPVREWSRESLTTVQETGKALVDWDQWRTNPARAAGLVAFNALTLAATDGAGTAATGTGRASRALSAAAKAGRAVDPMTYVARGAGTAARTALTGGRLATTRLSDLGRLHTPPGRHPGAGGRHSWRTGRA